jgi:DnaJ family protein C protein 27
MGVGKSCLIKRYCEQKFIARYISTIGVDFGVRPVVLEDGGIEVKVNFWDLSGDPDFLDVRTEFYEDTQAMLLVYDVTNRTTFDNLSRWLNEAEKHGARPLVTVVAANKVDEASRQVSEQEGEQWAQANKFGYYETSAKSGQDGTFSPTLSHSSSRLHFSSPRPYVLLPPRYDSQLDVFRAASARRLAARICRDGLT